MKIDASVISSQVSVAHQAAETSTTAANTDLVSQSPAKDLLSLTEEARRRSKEGLLAHHMGNHGQDGFPKIIADFLKDILKTLTGREVEDLEPSDAIAEIEGEPALSLAENLPAQTDLVAGFQQTSLTYQEFDLSMSGTLNTADGKQVAFTLDLQYDSARIASQSAEIMAGRDGIEFNFSGTAAELSSASFSFTLASRDLQGPTTGGHGRFNLNHEISAVFKEIKPLVKEFFSESGAPGSFSDLNRAVRSIA